MSQLKVERRECCPGHSSWQPISVNRIVSPVSHPYPGLEQSFLNWPFCVLIFSPFMCKCLPINIWKILLSTFAQKASKTPILICTSLGHLIINTILSGSPGESIKGGTSPGAYILTMIVLRHKSTHCCKGYKEGIHDSPGTSWVSLREGDLQGCSESLWSLPSREICECYDGKQGKEKAHVVSTT